MRTRKIQDLKHLAEAYSVDEGRGPSDAEACSLVPGQQGSSPGLGSTLSTWADSANSSVSRLYLSFFLFHFLSKKWNMADILYILMHVHFYYPIFFSRVFMATLSLTCDSYGFLHFPIAYIIMWRVCYGLRFI